jgi:hypothetical protein
MFMKREYPTKLTPGMLVLSAVNAEYVKYKMATSLESSYFNA